MRDGIVERDDVHHRGRHGGLFGEFLVHGGHYLHSIGDCGYWRVGDASEPKRDQRFNRLVHGDAKLRLQDKHHGWRHVRYGIVERDDVHYRRGDRRLFGEFLVQGGDSA